MPESAVAYSPDGEEWFVATTVGLDVAWAQGVAVGENAVVIVGESAEFYGDVQYGSDGGVTVELQGEATVTTTIESATTATTTIDGGLYSGAPETYVWVGRLR